MPIIRLPTLFRFVQAPFDPASTGNEEENETVQKSQLTFVYCREELSSGLELPVILNISDGHRSAAKESCRAGLKPQQHHQPTDEFDDPAEPELGPRRRLKLGKHSEDLLGAVEQENESCHDSQ